MNMPAQSLSGQNRSRAFRAYCAHGGNMTRAVESLQAEGLDVTYDQFRAWAEAANFATRLAQADALLLNEVGQYSHSRVLASLVLHSKKYEAAMNEMDVIDPQITYAYATLCKQIVKLLPPPEPVSEKTPEELREMAKEIFRQDFGV